MESGKISLLLKRFRIHGLIAKVPRSRRRRFTKKGWALLSAANSLKEKAFLWRMRKPVYNTS